MRLSPGQEVPGQPAPAAAFTIRSRVLLDVVGLLEFDHRDSFAVQKIYYSILILFLARGSLTAQADCQGSQRKQAQPEASQNGEAATLGGLLNESLHR